MVLQLVFLTSVTDRRVFWWFCPIDGKEWVCSAGSTSVCGMNSVGLTTHHPLWLFNQCFQPSFINSPTADEYGKISLRNATQAGQMLWYRERCRQLLEFSTVCPLIPWFCSLFWPSSFFAKRQKTAVCMFFHLAKLLVYHPYFILLQITETRLISELIFVGGLTPGIYSKRWKEKTCIY